MDRPNEIRAAIEGGKFKDALEYLRKNWSHERGERVVAQVGNDVQEMEYEWSRFGKSVSIKRRGWRDILVTTGIGEYEGRDGLRAIVIMTDGGRDETNRLVGLRFYVSVYSGEESVTGDSPIMVEDDIERKRVDNKWVETVVKSALDKLEGVLANLKVERVSKSEVVVN